MQCNKGKRRLPHLARGFAALCAALAMAAAGGASAAPKETVLHFFTGGDGDLLFAGLIADSAGNLYGTTDIGGIGYGNVFKLSPPIPPATKWTETVLYIFSGYGDGAFAGAGLIADRAGNLYGTTNNGGASFNGVVFKLSPPIPPATKWTETVLHSFCSKPRCSDGRTPLAGLIADSAGNLYSTTEGGCAAGKGVVFKLSPGGTETVLHSFTGSDGALPQAGLIADSAGNLYGTTDVGGASN